MGILGTAVIIIGGLILFGIIASAIVIIREWEEAIVLRFGKYVRKMKPGLQFRIPIIETVMPTDKRERSFDLEPQKILTKDTVPVKVDAIVFYKVNDVVKATIQVKNWKAITANLASVRLREEVSASDLNDLLVKREDIAKALQEDLDKATDSWGIEITGVRIQDVLLPEDMERAMAKEAEAEREKRARLIKASAEEEASIKLDKAAQLMSKNPISIRLRELQAYTEIGAEKNSLLLVVPSSMADKSLELAALAKSLEKK